MWYSFVVCIRRKRARNNSASNVFTFLVVTTTRAPGTSVDSFFFFSLFFFFFLGECTLAGLASPDCYIGKEATKSLDLEKFNKVLSNRQTQPKSERRT